VKKGTDVPRNAALVVKAPGLAEHHQFAGLTAFGRIEATREIDGEIKTEVRIYALSFVPKPAELLRIARTHWQIENGLHWELDVVMGEDKNRSRKDNAAQNIAVMRRLALNVARSDTSKGSLAGKLRRAGWNEKYLLTLLGQTR
jgi:predicted transposase YbfD/YdcC